MGFITSLSNIMQCTKQLKAAKCAFFFKPTNYILIQKWLNSHLQLFNSDADMKRDTQPQTVAKAASPASCMAVPLYVTLLKQTLRFISRSICLK